MNKLKFIGLLFSGGGVIKLVRPERFELPT